MRVGVNNYQYQIHIPLPPKIDPTVTMMQEEGNPDHRPRIERLASAYMSHK
jgi:ATP-dependent 26S proteasome regulatory subunit